MPQPYNIVELNLQSVGHCKGDKYTAIGASPKQETVAKTAERYHSDTRSGPTGHYMSAYMYVLRLIITFS